MNAIIHEDCLVEQRAAASWSQRAREWHAQLVAATHPITREACKDFAINAQLDAARLYAADRGMRLGDGA